MKINLLSSMAKSENKGGLYLRYAAISKIYKLLGFELHTLFQEDIKAKITLFSYIKSFLHGPRARLLFQEAELHLPTADYIHYENLRCFNWRFVGHEETPIIYNAHNLEFENYYNRTRSFYSQQFIRYELKQMERAKVIFLCSEREKNIILQFSARLAAKIFVLPNLVDRKNYRAQGVKDTISFIGTLDYPPNIKAVEFLCEKFMHYIPSDIKARYRFVIAGRSPVKGQAELAAKAGFIFKTGLCNEEIRKIYGATLISLVPLSSGSGTRLKIIEGIMSGARVVSTPLGHEGIETPLITSSSLYNFPLSFMNTLKSIEDEDMAGEFEKFKHYYDIETFYKTHEQQLKNLFSQN